MTLPLITLKAQKPERLGHPWIYDNEIARPPQSPFTDGGLVRIIDAKGRYAGVGYANFQSKIAVRFLSRNEEETVDADFFRRRLRSAVDYRRARYGTSREAPPAPQVWPLFAEPQQRGEGEETTKSGSVSQRPDGPVQNKTQAGDLLPPKLGGLGGPLPMAFRLVHGEADGLPGLVIDVYPGWAVVQFLALGLEAWRDVLLDELHSLLPLQGIYERSDSAVRKLEGLAETTGTVWGETPPDILTWTDAGAVIHADLQTGAKTGLFLDQRENQVAAAREAAGRDVLNCFAYTGLFGVRAALAGAKSVTDVEISPAFNALNEQQWKANALSIPHTAVTENVFDYLHLLDGKGYKTDMIVLDPPAFTKSRASRDGAVRGYHDINRTALRLLRPGGVLVTCSCSHHLSGPEFEDIVDSAARDARRSARLIERRGQPADHPVLFTAPETEYLKFLMLSVD